MNKEMNEWMFWTNGGVNKIFERLGLNLRKRVCVPLDKLKTRMYPKFLIKIKCGLMDGWTDGRMNVDWTGV